MLSIIGIDHNTAPIDIREAFSFAPGEIVSFLRAAKSMHLINGGVLVSTCNRMEVYVDSDLPAAELSHNLTRYIIEHKHMPNTLSKYFYSLSDEKMMYHLFALVSGFRSMVQGETQIVGQVKEALQLARSGSVTTNILLRLFDKALEIAKIVRAQHPTKAVNSSAGAAAVELLHRKYGEELLNGTHLLLGAGQMAATIIQSLRGLGVQDITLYNRTTERAERFGDSHGIERIFSEGSLPQALADTRWLWVATSASSPIITKELLYGEVPQAIFDMALPRNVAEDVAEIKGVSLFCIDDLEGLASNEGDELPPSVKEVVDGAISDFTQWQEGLAIRDIFSLMREDVDEMLTQEIANIDPSIDATLAALIQKHCRHLATTFSSTMIARLRKATDETKDPALADMMRKLLTM